MPVDTPPDVEALVREIRAEAEQARARRGNTRLPAMEPREVALSRPTTADSTLSEGRALTPGALRLAHLAMLADPGDVAFHSHRARVGRVIVQAKLLLRKLLTPILDRQGAFNRGAIDALGALDDAARARGVIVSDRLAEISSRLAAIEAALRPGAASRDGSAPAPGADAAPGLDRRAFEERFRGSREEIRARQARYLEHLLPEPGGPVVDLGCGRGEFLELLRERGIEAWGVELDENLATDAIVAGLDVRCGDALERLAAEPDRSLGAVVAFQVVEHLALADLLRLLALAVCKLRPGGCLVLETVNVESLVAWTRGWSIDPTHRQPVHPLTLRFLAEQAGFRDCRLVFSGEVAAEETLEVGEGDDREARNARRLNALLFGPNDYALVARA